MPSVHQNAVLGAVLAVVMPVFPVDAATITITVEKLVFSPAVVDAHVGDTIEWINKDVMAHTATADGAFDVIIPPHKSASTIVTGAASADYYCRFHPNMRGRIRINE